MNPLPPFAPGLRVGLFGGSFNPAHAGHRLVCEIALRRLALDRIWLLVTPGNPLKKNNNLAPFAERMARARAAIPDPRVIVSDLEAKIGVRYTFDTIDYVTRRAPGVRFCWIMGADNLGQFDRWQNWRGIAARLPMAIVDRPHADKAAFSKAAQALARWRTPEEDAPGLLLRRPPAWVFLHDRQLDLSSTAIRGSLR